ncbi:1-acyl-sn-glycerol-3-phosphate acyltransferase [Friedmanniella endophytica]|uniref:1-acyl-sn-glycerol-3-phosphate acyltransferase n=1 Tax=Microlunatus kandeliicorticis TaxID=1759536 RepID=A0A7W3P6Y0_9ACTN|nr:lysophospholipid acyltransferase family protein [Microlunatus kandeliicorticis]MBA8795448.1 1-acyl-sn-glycerol-3-phosphate acyltransferase [Microlunatus kandeliicorticis]
MSSSPARRPLRSVISEPAEPFLYRIVWVLGQLLRRTTRQDWRGQQNVPSTGGLVLVANHLSNFDPLALAHFLIWSGRWPRFLAKASLWKVPLVRTVVTRCGQIPVERNSRDSARGLTQAAAAVRAGKCVVVYPEGTITRDPELWPMAGKTGAARIALETGAPVVPVGQWGAQQVMPGVRPTLPRLLPRPTLRVAAGPPVDLDDLRGRPLTHDVTREATDRITAAITALVAELRGATPPAQPYQRAGATVPDPRPTTDSGDHGHQDGPGENR